MTKANIFEVKAKLSEYLDRAADGELHRHLPPQQAGGRAPPIRRGARRSPASGSAARRPKFEVPASFFEPMPDEELDSWEGVGPADHVPGWTVRPRAGRQGAEATGLPRAHAGAAPAVVRLLLDTCTFLWLAGGALAFGRAAAADSRPANEVFLSAASAGRSSSKYGRAGSASRTARSVDPHRAAAAGSRALSLRRRVGAPGLAFRRCTAILSIAC